MTDMAQTRKQLRKRRNTWISILSFTSFVLGFIAIIHPALPYPLLSTMILAILSLLLGVCGVSQSKQFQGFATIGIIFSLMYIFAVVVSVIGR
jgi:hypothetical protein